MRYRARFFHDPIHPRWAIWDSHNKTWVFPECKSRPRIAKLVKSMNAKEE